MSGQANTAQQRTPGGKKDPYWWVHPAFKGRQALKLDDLGVGTEDAFRWVSFEDQVAAPDRSADGIPIGLGKFKEFAQLLFKMNDCKPGPVTNWYVVVCVEAGKRWAVGQLCADPVTPVQIFEDLVFDSEAAARDRAVALKS
ncbi:MAG: hypothetical protein ACU85U_06360 [Gammaproteobacteria bacterium]